MGGTMLRTEHALFCQRLALGKLLAAQPRAMQMHVAGAPKGSLLSVQVNRSLM